MSTIGERLKAHWLAQDIPLSLGALEAHLHQFEGHFGVELPDDMREYFLHVNGMGGVFTADNNLFWDKDLFRFWPLQEVVRASDTYEDLRIDGRTSFFIFADHSICLPAYAIRLGSVQASCHDVISFSWDGFRDQFDVSIVASSFSEFVERYLGDDDSRDYLSLGMPP